MLLFISISLIFSIQSLTLSYETRQANGCGPIYFNIDEFLRNIGEEILINCCNEHDQCYETCGNKQMNCDRKFLHCMIESCQQLSNINRCQTDARILFWMVIIAGQSAYQQAQQQNQCFHNYQNKTIK